LDDLVSVVLRGYPGSLVEQDKTALRYCLSGYKNFPKRELVRSGMIEILDPEFRLFRRSLFTFTIAD
jgi:hypothetical protein